uniref:Uncharacterized protein n=1 Tax=Aegilops tauschii subsp. strangulata TaxID=200361 RepID=A0A453N7W3_AEGTS
MPPPIVSGASALGVCVDPAGWAPDSASQVAGGAARGPQHASSSATKGSKVRPFRTSDVGVMLGGGCLGAAGCAGACLAAPTPGARWAAQVGQWPGVAAAPAVDGSMVAWQVGYGGGWRPGVGLSVGCRPSTPLLVVRTLRPSKGWPSPSYGPLLVLRPVRKTELVSHTVSQDRARLAHGIVVPSSPRARCCRTGRWSQLWPAYWVSALGVAQGCESGDLSARLFGWGSGRSRVRWCQGLGCRGGGPGGGCAVLSGGGRGVVLPSGHGVWAAWSSGCGVRWR